MRAAALVVLACLAACGRPSGARPGDRVRLHYRVFADGRVYDSTEGAEPVEVVIGAGALPRPVEAALVGMRPGEERSLTVPDAYGRPDPANVQRLPRQAFAQLKEPPAVGAKVLGTRRGEAVEAVVTSTDAKTVTLSFDHPLAGKAVSFTLRLVSILR
jgi:FKBP-type peptidyl-prolyl cis-trans isomerase 2